MLMAIEKDRRGNIAGNAAIAIVAALLGVAFMGSTLLTPLYVIYEQAFGFSRITLTLIYAVYVVGNLIALLLLGRMSDKIGRRRMTCSPASLACWYRDVCGLARGAFFALVGLCVEINANSMGKAQMADGKIVRHSCR